MIKTIITDIEGTTSSLSFVKDVLFPYAAHNLVAFVENHKGDSHVKEILDRAKLDIGQFIKNEAKDSRAIEQILDIKLNSEIAELKLEEIQHDQISQIMLEWIKQDEKIGSLKELQGLIWEEGYKQRAFKGHIYEDAHKQLKKWQEEGILLFIYSSGSVKAQKLLFGHTDYGDLNNLFSGYFDTKIGHKKEAQSYLNIVEYLKENFPSYANVNEILFLSDIEAELAAAEEAGIQTTQLLRDVPINDDGKYKQVADFHSINLK